MSVVFLLMMIIFRSSIDIYLLLSQYTHIIGLFKFTDFSEPWYRVIQIIFIN